MVSPFLPLEFLVMLENVVPQRLEKVSEVYGYDSALCSELISFSLLFNVVGMLESLQINKSTRANVESETVYRRLHCECP